MSDKKRIIFADLEQAKKLEAEAKAIRRTQEQMEKMLDERKEDIMAYYNYDFRLFEKYQKQIEAWEKLATEKGYENVNDLYVDIRSKWRNLKNDNNVNH